MLPVVKFTAAACGGDAGGGCSVAPRISVSECAVCLSEFEERERVRLLPNCSHAFRIDCIDTWLQGSARCPFCRSDVTLPAARVPARCAPAAATVPTSRRDTELASDSIVIERESRRASATRPSARGRRARSWRRCPCGGPCPSTPAATSTSTCPSRSSSPRRGDRIEPVPFSIARLRRTPSTVSRPAGSASFQDGHMYRERFVFPISDQCTAKQLNGLDISG
ncbi:hypothetical protein PVAP13_9KG591301 [Panicum virgatum]|uniref:RING-type E3 ubiquitin transferase n=1 Tax=Panicum virgatum TaxID=38727 RepID=A0A8T0P5Y7_PANVG|nr:hypothetical protein PVAP13_9KG591301 [Panicum virgatum]